MRGHLVLLEETLGMLVEWRELRECISWFPLGLGLALCRFDVVWVWV